MKIKVSKFGGVCLSSPENIVRVKEIIKEDKNRLIIIVSAPGQRNSNDKKVTDLLYDCHNELLKNGNCNKTFKMIEDRFIEILNAYYLGHLKCKLKEIRANIEKVCDVNFTAAQGEYFTAIIMAEILGFKFVDAREIIKFKANGKVNFKKTYSKINKITNKIKQGVVIPGFYGELPNGNLLTFSRDGTDYTASLVSAGTGDCVYESFKDVSGIMATNPKLIKNPIHINQISYQELRELSYMGAKILHPSTVLPLIEKNIPIIVKSIYEPNGQKTTIINKPKNNHKIKAFTHKSDLTILSIKKVMVKNEIDFLYKCFKILKNLNINYVIASLGIDEIKLVINKNDFLDNNEKLIEKFNKFKPINLKIEENIALITIVGNDIFKSKNIVKILNKMFSENNIEIKLIRTNGVSNLIIGINEKDLQLATNIIYEKFF
ncbi:MAG: hypothetical protein PHS54_02100 [Clostridia bacterium]|nr:hypothetical protein [Clostridia bacterium]